VKWVVILTHFPEARHPHHINVGIDTDGSPPEKKPRINF